MSKQRLIKAKILLGRNSQFPHDMLRYDSCWPATEQDAHKMDRANGYDNSEPLEIVVQRSTDKPKREHWTGLWTIGRWRSFAVRIEPEGDPWD